MWFLNSTPENVDVKILVEAFGKSYQLTSLQFSVSDGSSDKPIYLAVPFPWSVHKENGSFNVINDERLDKLLQSSNTTRLGLSDVKLYENARKMKKETDTDILDLPTMRELWDVYTDEDMGIFVVKATPGVVYRIDYTHKISIFSTLFVQTRFSNFHTMKKHNFSVEIWVINGRKDNLKKYLELHNEKYDSFLDFIGLKCERLDRYVIKPSFDWSEDVRFGSNSWESSDESGSDDENEEEN